MTITVDIAWRWRWWWQRPNHSSHWRRPPGRRRRFRLSTSQHPSNAKRLSRATTRPPWDAFCTS